MDEALLQGLNASVQILFNIGDGFPWKMEPQLGHTVCLSVPVELDLGERENTDIIIIIILDY